MQSSQLRHNQLHIYQTGYTVFHEARENQLLEAEHSTLLRGAMGDSDDSPFLSQLSRTAAITSLPIAGNMACSSDNWAAMITSSVSVTHKHTVSGQRSQRIRERERVVGVVFPTPLVPDNKFIKLRGMHRRIRQITGKSANTTTVHPRLSELL